MSDGATYLIPADPANPHPLGRHVHHDPRNRDHRALVTPPVKSVREFPTWASRTVFDQGSESSCTAQASAGLLFTAPFASQARQDRLRFDQPAERLDLYREAQKVDPWPGEAYEGSSTDAPFRVMRTLGVIQSWKWLFGIDEIREWLRWFGPVAVGTVWLDGMFEPNPRGFLEVSGNVAGGHAYRLVSYSARRAAFRVVNSWGRGWGDAGRVWIAAADLGALIANDGDAVTVG